MKFLFHDRIQEGDFSGRILAQNRNCPASSDLQRIEPVAMFQRAFELGVNECQLKEGGGEIALAKRILPKDSTAPRRPVMAGPAFRHTRRRATACLMPQSIPQGRGNSTIPHFL